MSTKLKIQQEHARSFLPTLIATVATVLAIAAIWLLPNLAHAGDGPYARHGAWYNYANATHDNSDFICGMFVGSKNKDMVLHVKYFIADNSLALQLYKRGWNIPDGTEIAMEVGFDKDLFGSADKAWGGMAQDSPGYGEVELNVNPELVKKFIEEFSHANKMWIRFPQGNEEPWFADMTGSRKAMEDLVSCVNQVHKVAREYKPPTQPFKQQAPAESTQPMPTIRKGDRDA